MTQKIKYYDILSRIIINLGGNMLKRQQILLEDWMVEYTKFLSEIYDTSFSEAIRIALCLEYLDTVNKLHPKHKSALSKKRFLQLSSKVISGAVAEKDVRSLISKLYFEARKAAEYRMSCLKKEQKKKRKN